MSAAAGRVLMMPKGDYSPTTKYDHLDWVRYNNAAWVCKTDNTQNVPPSLSAPEWQILVYDSAIDKLEDLSDVVLSSEAEGQYLGIYIDNSTTPPTITWKNLSAETDYDPTSTAPISGVGVYKAFDELLEAMTEGVIPVTSYLVTDIGDNLVDHNGNHIIALKKLHFA